jgi:hypothetical protein
VRGGLLVSLPALLLGLSLIGMLGSLKGRAVLRRARLLVGWQLDWVWLSPRRRVLYRRLRRIEVPRFSFEKLSGNGDSEVDVCDWRRAYVVDESKLRGPRTSPGLFCAPICHPYGGEKEIGRLLAVDACSGRFVGAELGSIGHP